MKKVLYIVMALEIVCTFASGKWIEPVGTNFADFETAKKVCRAAGGRLPTFSELKRVAQNCGLRVTKFGTNRVSRAIHSCLRRKGFNQETYWTRTRYKNLKDHLKGVNFYIVGETAISPYASKAFIRCVR